MGSLDGQVAWVVGGGGGIGRAAALSLAARGARLLVTGPDERALGAVVGEIVHGGGKGRHAVAASGDSGAIRAAAARARELFGRLDIVLAAAGEAPVAPVAFGGEARGPGRPLSRELARRLPRVRRRLAGHAGPRAPVRGATEERWLGRWRDDRRRPSGPGLCGRARARGAGHNLQRDRRRPRGRRSGGDRRAPRGSVRNRRRGSRASFSRSPELLPALLLRRPVAPRQA